MSQPYSKTETSVLTDIQPKQPRLYKVILLNDDFTTMEFVVMILQTIFEKPYEEAVHIMLKVHREGKGVAGIYTKEIAETKAVQTMNMAASEGFPLRCIIEPE